MLYDDKQMSQREGLYTVVGALVLAIILFVLFSVFKIVQTRPSTDGGGYASTPNAMPLRVQTSNVFGWRRNENK